MIMTVLLAKTNSSINITLVDGNTSIYVIDMLWINPDEWPNTKPLSKLSGDLYF